MMRIAIVGSRTYPRLQRVVDFVRMLNRDTNEVVSGGAQGVDSVAAQEAQKRNMKVTVFRPDWDKHQRSAGFIRNAIIVKNADVVVAFWDGTSKGTAHTIDIARKAGKPVIVMRP